MTYKEKYDIYAEEFGIVGLEVPVMNELFNLVGVLWVATVKKRPEVKPYEILSKVLKTEVTDFDGKKSEVPWESLEYFTVTFSIQLEFLIKKCNFKPSPLGFTTSEQIVSKINKLMEEWVPF